MFPLFAFKFHLHLKVNTNAVVGGRGGGQFLYNLLIPYLGEILLLWPSSQQTKLVILGLDHIILLQESSLAMMVPIPQESIFESR